MRVFVPDGLQFVVGRGGERAVELPDHGRQVRELVARVELQDGSLRHARDAHERDVLHVEHEELKTLVQSGE